MVDSNSFLVNTVKPQSDNLHNSLPKQQIPNTYTNTCKVLLTQALSHFRLGHLSDNRLNQMAQLYPQNFNDKAICDVCHFARHKKNSYSLSNS